jgi:3,4-dihydroxy 2-butanone 4-phosphate synthase / GTP cyclohydrolase II
MPQTPIALSPEVLRRVNAAIADVRAGKMVIIVDDEDRENEGDLVMAAQFTTKESVNFMATHGRGLICVTLTEEQIERLALPMMQAPGRAGPPLGTAFTFSVEARHGVSTGISAEDRARTILVASDPNSQASDLVSPGHVFPLRARKGGVLVRTGQTEGSVDLARLAGLTPAGVICEIMNEDGSMARMPDLERFAEKHSIRILSVADLIQYRLETERLVVKVSEKEIILDQTNSKWRAIRFQVQTDGRYFLALVKGEVRSSEPVLCRMHRGSMLADLFSSSDKDGGKRLRQSIEQIESAGRGVVVYMPTTASDFSELDGGAPAPPDTKDATGRETALRELGLGAQVLRELGVQQIRLLTTNPRKIAGLEGFRLSVVENVALTLKD